MSINAWKSTAILNFHGDTSVSSSQKAAFSRARSAHRWGDGRVPSADSPSKQMGSSHGLDPRDGLHRPPNPSAAAHGALQSLRVQLVMGPVIATLLRSCSHTCFGVRAGPPFPGRPSTCSSPPWTPPVALVWLPFPSARAAYKARRWPQFSFNWSRVWRFYKAPRGILDSLCSSFPLRMKSIFKGPMHKPSHAGWM